MASALILTKFFVFQLLLVAGDTAMAVVNGVSYACCGDYYWASFSLGLPFVPGILAIFGFTVKACLFPQKWRTCLKDSLKYLFFPFLHCFR